MNFALHVVAEQIQLPLPISAIKSFFSWLSTNTELPKKKIGFDHNFEDLIDSDDDDGFGNNDVTISSSTMQGYKSALMWLYEQSSIHIPMDINSYLNEFLQGYKKSIAEKKSKGVMSITEGKSPISFKGKKIKSL